MSPSVASFSYSSYSLVMCNFPEETLNKLVAIIKQAPPFKDHSPPTYQFTKNSRLDSGYTSPGKKLLPPYQLPPSFESEFGSAVGATSRIIQEALPITQKFDGQAMEMSHLSFQQQVLIPSARTCFKRVSPR